MAVINSADDYAGAGNDALVTPAVRGVTHSASSTAFKPTRAFHALGTETIVVDFHGGGSAVSLAVNSGQTYPYRIVKCSTTTSGIVLLH